MAGNRGFSLGAAAVLALAFLIPLPSSPSLAHPGSTRGPEAFARSIGTASYLMLVDGRVVASFGDLTRNYRLHSIRKSILSALVGIEVERGRLSLGDTLEQLGISDYSPLSVNEAKATFAHLLNSNSGVYRSATYENEGYDKVRPARESHTAGTRWFYSNWDFNVVGSIFQQKTLQSICAAFLQNIAVPIGLRDFSLDNCSWRYSDRSRHPAYIFEMSTRDLASFGELMRKRGTWNGRKLVPEKWIAASTSPISEVSKPDGTAMPGVSYGYMWWTARSGNGHFPGLNLDLGPGAYIASGTGTQLLIVAPARRLVFVHRVDTEAPQGKSASQDDIGRLLAMLLERRKSGFQLALE